MDKDHLLRVLNQIAGELVDNKPVIAYNKTKDLIRQVNENYVDQALADRLKGAIDNCLHDTWECEQCGNSEPWWTNSNAHYLSEYPNAPSEKDAD